MTSLGQQNDHPQNDNTSNIEPDIKDAFQGNQQHETAILYEKRAKELLGDFDKKLTDESINVAIVVILDPKCDRPIIYGRGDTIYQTKVAVELAKRLKQKLNEELSI